MRASFQTDYAFRILIFLQWQNGKRASIREIAEVFDLSLNHLNKVNQKLVKLGLIHSTRGQGGGIELIPETDSYKLGDLMRILEGDHEIAYCSGNSSLSACNIASSCSLRGFFSDAKEAFYEHLNQKTIADLKATPPSEFSAL